MGDIGTLTWTVEIGADEWRVQDGAGNSWAVAGTSWPLDRVRDLVGQVLGREVAEHHILAAHGEGIFRGLSGPNEGWSTRLLHLLRHLDRLRAIIAEWPEGHQMMSRTELKTRAWNDAIIGDLLKPAATLPNPHYDSGGEMVLFDTRKVLAAERTQRWLESTAQLRARRIVRAAHPTATRAERKRARDTAAIDPAEHRDELICLATGDEADPVRAVATDCLLRHWRGRVWTPADLDDPLIARFAAMIGGADVLAAAIDHADPEVRLVASRRVLESMAG